MKFIFALILLATVTTACTTANKPQNAPLEDLMRDSGGGGD